MLPQTWNLDILFDGGSRSPAFANYLEDLESLQADLRREVESLPAPESPASIDRWAKFVHTWQQAQKRLIQARSFVECLTAQNTGDEDARLLEGRMHQFAADLEGATNLLEARMRAVSDRAWQNLLGSPAIANIAWALDERRRLAEAKLPKEQELLATDLSVSGYHSWGSLYSTLEGRITIPWEEEGEVRQLSAGQANLKFSDPNPAVRDRAMERWAAAWGGQAEIFAATLNNLAGFRLALYDHRKWDSFLKEPLELNRMSHESLDAMWDAVQTGKAELVKYLDRKARLIGRERLLWQDQSAPLGKVSHKIPYDEAAAVIETQFRKFSPRMADFAAHALREGWIESADRSGKAPGGFCTDFPDSGQTRIFMTYGGDADSLTTLAHELGHAYHSSLVFDLDPLNQNYAMNVAETASTLAELITVNAAIASAPTRAERLVLLDTKLQASSAYLMNIHARFLFETRFYAERRKGPVGTDQLKELMVTAQREGFADALGSYYPYFWASKGHFYATYAPFYNFPYTFGYLFSAGVHAIGAAEGPAFASRYAALLRDTGRMTTEELARRHLGADLTRTDFWLTGLRMATADVAEFLRLTELD